MKTEEQQGILALHRVRQQLVKFRTAQINCLRGLLAEYGEVMPRGRAGMRRDIASVLERVSQGLPALVVETLRPVLSAPAGLHADQTGRAIGEVVEKLRSRQPQVDELACLGLDPSATGTPASRCPRRRRCCYCACWILRLPGKTLCLPPLALWCRRPARVHFSPAAGHQERRASIPFGFDPSIEDDTVNALRTEGAATCGGCSIASPVTRPMRAEPST